MNPPLHTLRFRESDRQKMLEVFHDRSKLAELAIPRFICNDGVLMVNPEWTDAAYEEVFFEHQIHAPEPDL